MLAAGAFGQIAQDHPEICGSRVGALKAVPPGVTASLDRSQGITQFTLEVGDSPVTLQLSADGIEQVCTIQGDRLLVAAETIGASVIYIVSQKTGALLDSFYAWDPVMSPNQRWLILRKFYPVHMDVPYTEEYLLYDLSKDKAGNRSSSESATGPAADVGRAVYPVGLKNTSLDNINVPEDKTHRFYSGSFYWAPNSQSVVFADNLQGKLSIVLVTIEGDTIKTFVHPVTLSEACGESGKPDASTHAIEVSQPEIVTNQGGDREVRLTLNFNVSAPLCRGGQELVLHSSDFQPAPIETFPKPELTPAEGTN